MTRARCTSSPKPRSSPSPTATTTSATPTSCRCPSGLLDAGYLAVAAQPHQPGDRDGRRPSPGTPPKLGSIAPGDDEHGGAGRAPATSPSSIADGNAISHDHHHRGRLRLAPVGGGLPAQQRAHRFRLPPRRRRRPAARQRRGPGQAPAQLDGADHRLRRAGQAVGRARLARRPPHHPVRREDAGGADRLEARCPAGSRADELRQPRPGLRDRG